VNDQKKRVICRANDNTAHDNGLQHAKRSNRSFISNSIVSVWKMSSLKPE